MDSFNKSVTEMNDSFDKRANKMVKIAIIGAIIQGVIILSVIIGLLWLIKQWFF